MTKLFIVVFRDEVVKTFTTYTRTAEYVNGFGNIDYSIHEVNYE